MPDIALEPLDTVVGGTTVHVRRGGSGPAVLLLHGFPETSAMWRDIAPLLAEECSVVCADLPGYGRSGVPVGDRAAQSKREISATMVELMTVLGHDRFAVVGHDRGARVAYRTALDHPERVMALAVLDAVPIEAAWSRADDRFALGFWPWSLLAQDAPLPERLIGGAPEAVIDHALGAAWGTPADVFPAAVRQKYIAQLRDPQRVHAICEEYRAAAGVDREHDRADVDAGRTIAGPVLALWSESGPVGSWYEAEGGPLALWRPLAPQVQGHAVPGGHFFPEEHPAETASALLALLAG